MALRIPEKAIVQITGRAIPKLANDQNTDDIMPARFLKEITFRNMGEYVYADERVKEGMRVTNHPFEEYAGGKILLAGANYGCGSSREHAPQGLYRFGIRAIVAESFAEIFAGNCAMIGLVPVTAHRADIERLAGFVKSYPDMDLSLFLDYKSLDYDVLEGPMGRFDIDLPEGRRQAFLNGTWDSMAVLQANQEEAENVGRRLGYLK